MTYKITNISNSFVTVSGVVLKPSANIVVPVITPEISVLKSNKKVEVIPLTD